MLFPPKYGKCLCLFKFYLSRSNEPPSIQNRPVLSSNYKVEVQQGVIYRTQLISETTSTKVKQTVRGTTIKSHLSSLNGHPSIPSVFPSSNYKVEVQQSVSYKGHPSQGLHVGRSSRLSTTLQSNPSSLNGRPSIQHQFVSNVTRWKSSRVSPTEYYMVYWSHHATIHSSRQYSLSSIVIYQSLSGSPR